MTLELPISPVLIAFSLPFLLWFLMERAVTLMMFFQQEEYDGQRFIAWIRDNRAYDRCASVWFLGAILVSALTQSESLSAGAPIALPLVLAGVAHGILRSRRGRKNTKKPLVFTTRVKRILSVYLVLALGAAMVLFSLASLAPQGRRYSMALDVNGLDFFATDYDWRLSLLALAFLVLIQAVPFLMVIANKLLEPMEERVKAAFRKEALDKMAALDPYVIGITGSFGKTSTKHILSHILEAAAPTLATPGSVNTDMGITRVIREQLTPDHHYFIVEMGAYGPGSITRLCRLTPPKLGVITAVGAAHYERFRSLETVARAKFELAEQTFQNDGQVIVNSDGIRADLLNAQKAERPGGYVSVGAEADFTLETVEMDASGVHIQLQHGEDTEKISAPLYGLHQAGNIAAAAVTARTLGLPWTAIRGALKSLPQIRFRLEVTKTAGQPTIINDAYNSNPVGFKAAVEVLDVLRSGDGRRILVTPGMVELGDRHADDHYSVGRHAAGHTDIAVVVTPERIPTFLDGLKDGKNEGLMVLTFERQAEAEAWVRDNARVGDAILYENNLPDLYEATVVF